jgi:hypothetical protein
MAITDAEVRLINLGITVAAELVPKLIAWFASMGDHATAEKLAADLARADGVDDHIKAEARKALLGTPLDPGNGIGG